MTTFSYDSMNRLVSSTDPLSRTESYQYDLNGNLIRKTKRDGAAIDFTYDATNHLISKVSPSPSTGEGGGGGVSTTTYTYDLNGNLTGVADPDSSLSFAYDPLDRVIRTQSSVLGAQSSPVIDYIYDPVGNRLSMTADSSQVTAYAYDVMNRLISLSNPDSQIWNFSYDVAGRRTSLTHPNGILTTYSYDRASRLLALHHDHSTTGPLAHFDYAYDPVGNRIQKGELEGSTGYGYDALNRLTSASTTVPGLPQEFYTYDAVGNRVTSHVSANHVVDAANQLLEDQQFTYTYDPNGNQTGKTAKDDSEKWAYFYDAENQLVGAQRFAQASSTVALMAASYGYDGLGRRIVKTVNGVTTSYVYDNEDILSFSDARVTHGPGVDEPLAVAEVTLVLDALGSVAADVSATGTKRSNYESFGSIKPPSATPYGFTSREFDPETGLLFYRTRHLDPTAGRFLSRDKASYESTIITHSILGSSGTPLFLRYQLLHPQEFANGWVYVGNRPLIAVDPFGYFSWAGVTGTIMMGTGGALIVLPGGGVPGACLIIGGGALTLYDWYDTAKTFEETGKKVGEKFIPSVPADPDDPGSYACPAGPPRSPGPPPPGPPGPPPLCR